MSTGTKNSQNPVSQKYRTPLQLFTADLAPSIAASPHLLDRRVLEKWQKMSEEEKDVYRVRASKQSANVIEPSGISLPSQPTHSISSSTLSSATSTSRQEIISATSTRQGRAKSWLRPVKPLFHDISLPPGWHRQVVMRTRGETAGRYDVYVYTPDGKKLRSSSEVQLHLFQNGITDIDPESISFKVEGPTLNRLTKKRARQWQGPIIASVEGGRVEEGEVEEQESKNRGTNEESESQSNRAKDDNDIHVLLEDSDDEWIPGMLKN